MTEREHELEALLAQRDADLERAAMVGTQLLDRLRVAEEQNMRLRESEAQVARLRGHLDERMREDEAREREQKELEASAAGPRLEALVRKHHEAIAGQEALKGELQEAEEEIEVLRRENQRLRLEADRLRQEVQGVTLMHQHQTQGGVASPATPDAFGAISKEQLRAELLEAALAQQALDKRVVELENERAQLEGTVLSLMRQNQKLSDQLEEAAARHGSGAQRSGGGADMLNSSLADELSDSLIDFGASSQPTSPVAASPLPKPAGGAAAAKTSLFADMDVEPAPAEAAPQLFAEMEVRDNDRQYRDYVLMTVTAVKVGLAIRYAANPTAADRACQIRPKAVLNKAIEMRVPLHQVHAFVRKYAQAYVEKVPPRPAPAEQGLLSRVLGWFPGSDYLTRASEVVPNRGAELGSFLWKKGSFLSRAWKQRWFKLNTSMNVVSYHVDPHIFNALGTIRLDDIGKVEVLPPQGGYEHVFCIYCVNGREFVLAADTATQRTYWVDGIRQALADQAMDRLSSQHADE